MKQELTETQFETDELVQHLANTEKSRVISSVAKCY
jgi:hypothetical protein